MTLSSCEIVGDVPRVEGTLRSRNADLRSFRIEVVAIDSETGEFVGSNSRLVGAFFDEPQPFDLLLINIENLAESQPVVPDSVTCSARVLYSS